MTSDHNHAATREQSRVAIVTCAELADLEPDDRLLLTALLAAGVDAEAVPWDATSADWASYDLAVLRSPWDYAPRRDEFVAWAASVPRLANPADIVAWNTDKRYLRELAAQGVPVVPTTWVSPKEVWSPPPAGEYVIKPAISAGSKDTGRYQLADAEHRQLAAQHVARLQAAGRLVMVQPYLPAVDTYGETALIFFAVPGTGTLAYSHAIRKGPMLTGPDRGEEGLYKAETITARTPIEAEVATAEKILAAVPTAAALLYARVDLIPGPDGTPLLVELELTEPSLFLGHADGAPERLAASITALLP